MLLIEAKNFFKHGIILDVYAIAAPMCHGFHLCVLMRGGEENWIRTQKKEVKLYMTVDSATKDAFRIMGNVKTIYFK